MIRQSCNLKFIELHIDIDGDLQGVYLYYNRKETWFTIERSKIVMILSYPDIYKVVIIRKS